MLTSWRAWSRSQPSRTTLHSTLSRPNSEAKTRCVSHQLHSKRRAADRISNANFVQTYRRPTNLSPSRLTNLSSSRILPRRLKTSRRSKGRLSKLSFRLQTTKTQQQTYIGVLRILRFPILWICIPPVLMTGTRWCRWTTSIWIKTSKQHRSFRGCTLRHS